MYKFHPISSHLLLLLSVCPALVVVSCAGLKGINTFAVSSGKVLAQPFPYTYERYCRDSCYIYDTTANEMSYPCNCQHAIDHDTDVIRESGKLSNYFIAVAKLSGSDDVIDVDTIAGAVKAGKYGSLNITSTDANVASAVATGIQDLLTAQFKSKHLEANLKGYGSSVESSLEAYVRHLRDVQNKTHDMRINLELRLRIYRENAAPKPGRWAVLHAYNEKIADLIAREQQFDTLVRQIQLVHDGFEQLVNTSESIRSKTLKKKLLGLVQNIVYLSSH